MREAHDILQSLTERMGKSDPEDFELDKLSDCSSTSSIGQKNRTLAKIVMGVYEVKVITINVFRTVLILCDYQ